MRLRDLSFSSIELLEKFKEELLLEKESEKNETSVTQQISK